MMMKGLLVVLVLLVASVVGVGFYQGWFHFTVDKEKFQEDEKKATEKVKKLWPKAKDKTGVPADKVKEANPETAPDQE
jgi:uncharacterized membrane protein YciS (DUF1049 family)